MGDKYVIDRINGERGLKALKDFHQGETIMSLPNIFLNEPDKYSIEVKPGIHVDCTSFAAGAINHSCTPNAAVRDWRIVAWSCIQTGDPITINYKKTERNLAAPFDCRCGHQLCLGRVE